MSVVVDIFYFMIEFLQSIFDVAVIRGGALILSITYLHGGWIQNSICVFNEKSVDIYLHSQEDTSSRC